MHLLPYGDARMKLFFSRVWCRVVYGHIMIPFGKVNGKMAYMCARCTLCQTLHPITGREDE